MESAGDGPLERWISKSNNNHLVYFRIMYLMAMLNQHPTKSYAISVIFGHCIFLLPLLRVIFYFFMQSGVGKLLAWAAGD